MFRHATSIHVEGKKKKLDAGFEKIPSNCGEGEFGKFQILLKTQILIKPGKVLWGNRDKIVILPF